MNEQKRIDFLILDTFNVTGIQHHHHHSPALRIRLDVLFGLLHPLLPVGSVVSSAWGKHASE